MTLIDDVRSAALEAGELMRRGFTGVRDKGTKDNHVTDADVAVQELLRGRLAGILPEAAFVGEEGDFSEAKEGLRWIVDPIDGTTNFIRGLPLSVTSIALAEGDAILLGVVYNPFTGEMYSAEKGKGAFLGDHPIRVSDRPLESSIYCTSWGAYDKRGSAPAFRVAERMYAECEDIRRLGSAAYEMCKLAEGRVDVFFEPIIYPWDHAAASVIVAEAGGLVSSLDGPASLDRMGKVFAANSSANMEHIRRLVREEFQS